MGAKHTPGPWRVEAHPNPGFLNFIKASKSTVIAETVDEANAKLIAAAPDLASLLSELLAEVETEIANRDGHNLCDIACDRCEGGIGIHSLGCRIQSALRKAGVA